MVGIVVTIGIAVWESTDPDIRFAYSQPVDNLTILDTRFEGIDTRVSHVAFRVAFTNRSWKSGFVESVELVPLDAVKDFISARVTTVDRQPIRWRESLIVNIRAIITSRSNLKVLSIQNTPRPPGGPQVSIKAEQQPMTLELELRATDSAGRSVSNFEDERYKAVRMVVRFEGKPPKAK